MNLKKKKIPGWDLYNGGSVSTMCIFSVKNHHCLIAPSAEPEVSIQRLFAAIEDKWESLDGTLNTKRIIY